MTLQTVLKLGQRNIVILFMCIQRVITEADWKFQVVISLIQVRIVLLIAIGHYLILVILCDDV